MSTVFAARSSGRHALPRKPYASIGEHARRRASRPVRRLLARTMAVLGAVAALVTASVATGHASVVPAGGHAVTRSPGLAFRTVASVVSGPRYAWVRSGDTLSAIAARLGHPGGWPSLWWVNRALISDPNSIRPGWRLSVPASWAVPAWMSERVWAAMGPVLPVVALASYSSAPVSSGFSGGSYGGGTPGGSFGQCVVARESGGNAQVMNATGHYGLYQFSEPTWVAYGGSAGDFGHASVSEQEHVFANALAAGGESNWAPYDGC
jgi:Transglycosylase-like domain/LysM domain